MATRVWGLSKKNANYRPAPQAEVRCDRCKYMFPPLALGGCRLVRGRSGARPPATSSDGGLGGKSRQRPALPARGLEVLASGYLPKTRPKCRDRRITRQSAA